MKESIAYIVVGLVFLFLAAILNSCTQSMAMDRCAEAGGQYYKSIDAGKSLCKLPQKAV